MLSSVPEKTAFPLFEQNYATACDRLLAGEQLTLPAPPATSGAPPAPRDFDTQRAALKKLREQTGL